MRNNDLKAKWSKLRRRGDRPSGWWRVIAVMMTAILGASAFADDGAISGKGPGLEPMPTYRLDSSDQLRLKVFEWRPALDRVFEWTALNDTYIVGPSGNVSLPLVGEVGARGATPAEFGERIGKQMLEVLGLANVPKISVEVVKFRPFYVSGEVQQPGEYPYRPRLTVLQAFAIAGGIARERDSGRHINRELISGEADVGLYSAERNSLVAQRARLQAQMQGLANPNFPSELDRTDPEIDAILRRETGLFEVQQRNLNGRLDILNTNREHLEAQVRTLEAQIENHRAERQLADDELEKVRSLVSRRLAVEPRRLAAQRNVYQLGSVGLRLESDLRQVRQEITKTLSDIEEYRGSQNAKIMQDLRETERRIAELDRRVAASRHLLLDSARVGGANSLDAGMEMELAFEIVRESNGRVHQFSADEKTYVLPGDTIKVDVKSPPLFLSNAPGGLGKTLRPYTADALAPLPMPATPKEEIRAGSETNVNLPAAPDPEGQIDRFQNPTSVTVRESELTEEQPTSDRNEDDPQPPSDSANDLPLAPAQEAEAVKPAAEPPRATDRTADDESATEKFDMSSVSPSMLGYFVPLPSRSPLDREPIEFSYKSKSASAKRHRHRSAAIIRVARR